MRVGNLNHDKKDQKDGKKSKVVSYLAVGVALGAAVVAAVKNIKLGLAL